MKNRYRMLLRRFHLVMVIPLLGLAALNGESDNISPAQTFYTVTESSDPASFLPVMTTSVAENQPYTVTNLGVLQGNYRLAFWTLNGVRATDLGGRGLLRPTFIVTEDTDAVAQFIQTGVDGDGDRLDDWWEFWMFGDRSRGPQDNDDGDAFNHEAEFTYGYDATVFDTARPGGVASRLSASVSFLEANANRYVIKSEPFGILQQQEGLLPAGDSLTTPYLLGDSTGHTFVGWEVDGVPQRSPDGLYLSRITVTPTDDVEIVARYVALNEDADADGILDSYELQQFGNLSNDRTSDPDGDGFDMDYELRYGFSPVRDDAVRGGGLASRLSATATFVVGKSLYTVDSIPLGLIASESAYLDDGTEKTTSYYGTSLVNGYEFGYLTINGSRMADPSGLALRQARTTVAGRTTVLVHFFPPGEDSDADGIDDVDEWRTFGSLDNDRGSNPDADAFLVGEELDFGYSLLVADEQRAGGIGTRLSRPVRFNNSNKVFLETRSEPLGLIASTGEFHDPDTTLTSAHYNFTTEVNGHYFTHWTLNGVRVEAPSGMARRQVVFDISADSVLVAHFTLADEDADEDGILDYRELRLASDLTQISPASDLDGDGFTVGEEQAYGFSELLADEVRGGGVATRLSNLRAVNLFSAPTGLGLTSSILPERSPVGTAVGTFVTTAPNPDDAFVYALVPGDGSDDNALFRIDGDKLESDRVFDFPSDSVFFVRVRVTDTRSNTYEEALVVNVVFAPITTYGDFLFETFTPAEQADPLISGKDIDIEKDGLSNFQEYVHVLDPFSGDGHPVRIIDFLPGTTSTSREARIAFSWREGMSDAAYSVSKSTDFLQWDPVPHSVLSSELEDGVREVILQVQQPPPHPLQELYRLVIEEVP